MAGVGFCLGLMLTLALAPVALLLIIQTIMERWTRRAEFNTRCVRADVGAVGCAVVGVAVPLIAVSLWGQCNIIAIWFQNLQNHGMFYTHNSRSFGTWLAVNPMEAAFALGLPIAGLVILGTIRSLRDRASAAIGFSQTIAWIAVWLILWLSGKNMGEAARLWIFLAPWPVITAATATLSIGETKPLTDHRFSWQVLLALQLLVTLWTMVCVDGFHFAELIPAS